MLRPGEGNPHPAQLFDFLNLQANQTCSIPQDKTKKGTGSYFHRFSVPLTLLVNVGNRYKSACAGFPANVSATHATRIMRYIVQSDGFPLGYSIPDQSM